MAQESDIRQQVAEAYTRAVNSGSCCGGEQKGVTAQLAGYAPEELASLPADAVENSFGCGNPVAFSDVRPGETVLDLGSGAGIDLLLAAQKVGSEGKVIGVDMTDEMIARARANVAAAGYANVEVRKGYIEELPVEDSSVDLVISNCVLNLSPDKARVFSEIARVLKPGGRLRVSDIVAEDLPQWARESAALYSSCVAGAISEADYVGGLADAGLVDVRVLDRMTYDETQLQAMVLSDLPQAGVDVEALAGSVPSCCCGPAPRAEGVPSAASAAATSRQATPAGQVEALIGRAASEMAGKIAQVLVTGRRPA
jgi:SAM-dependent methyltransferase